MNEQSPVYPSAGFDKVLAFAIPDRDCRGRVLRLGPVLETILSAHDYPPPIRSLLAEALLLTGLMGGLLKGKDDQLTLQAQARDAVVGLLVCDYRDGELRGYVQHDAERLAAAGPDPDLRALFGEGSLAITFEIAATGKRYQGVVPLEGASMSEAVEAYFSRSEQLPTLIGTAVVLEGAGAVAGGILVQHLPQGEEGRERLHLEQDREHWNHVATICATVGSEELVDPELPLEHLVWRLFNEEQEVRVEPLASVARGCRCTEQHFESVLARFPSVDRKEMRDERGIILVDCAFCSREFAIQD